MNRSVIVCVFKAGSLFKWSHQMLLVGPSKMWAELLKVQTYPFIPTGKDAQYHSALAPPSLGRERMEKS